MRMFEDFSSVRLEHYPFPRTKRIQVNHSVILFRELLQEIVLISFRFLVNASLGTLQRSEITPYFFIISVIADQETNHERCVDNLAEAVLFQDINRRTEYVTGCYLPVQ